MRRMLAIAVALVALLAFTATSYGLSQLHLGAWEASIAIGIAVLKAGVVALVFMELHRHGWSSAIVALTALAMIALLIVFVLFDVNTRTGQSRPSSFTPAPAPPPPAALRPPPGRAGLTPARR